MATEKSAGICAIMPNIATVIGHLVDSPRFRSNMYRRMRKASKANFFIHDPASTMRQDFDSHVMIHRNTDQVVEPHTMIHKNNPAPSDKYKGVAPELYLY